MAGVMDEPQIGEIVRATLLLGHHRMMWSASLFSSAW
jgi:hypothetical protein